MEITHDVLLRLGFIEIPNRLNRYSYKGVTGRLEPEEGRFVFHGLSFPVEQLSDLKYLLMLIDYNHQVTLQPYPFHQN
ncbi:hypothetical protein [Spirosoma fluminis]